MVLTLSDMHSVSSETSSLPHERSLFWQKRWTLSAHKLIRNGFVTVRIKLVLVGHLPRPARHTIIIRGCFPDGLVLCLLSVECISIEILFGSDLASALSSIDLEDCVVWPVNVGVDAETEKMLVVVCVDTGVNFCSPAFGVLAWVHGIGV